MSEQSYAARQWAAKRTAAIRKAELLREQRKSVSLAIAEVHHNNAEDQGELSPSAKTCEQNDFPGRGVSTEVPLQGCHASTMAGCSARGPNWAGAVQTAHKLSSCNGHAVAQPVAPDVAYHRPMPSCGMVAPSGSGAATTNTLPLPAAPGALAHADFVAPDCTASPAFAGSRRRRWDVPHDGQHLVLPVTGVSPLGSLACGTPTGCSTPLNCRVAPEGDMAKSSDEKACMSGGSHRREEESRGDACSWKPVEGGVKAMGAQQEETGGEDQPREEGEPADDKLRLARAEDPTDEYEHADEASGDGPEPAPRMDLYHNRAAALGVDRRPSRGLGVRLMGGFGAALPTAVRTAVPPTQAIEGSPRAQSVHPPLQQVQRVGAEPQPSRDATTRIPTDKALPQSTSSAPKKQSKSGRASQQPPFACGKLPHATSPEPSLEQHAPNEGALAMMAQPTAPARTSIEHAAAQPLEFFDPDGGVPEKSGEQRRTFPDANLASLADEDPVTRQMVDKRQSRKANKEAFLNALAEWRATNPLKDDDGSKGGVGERAPLGDLTQPQPGSQQRRLRAIVRKRPLFQYEAARGEFDVVSVRGSSGIVVHNCCMQPDLKRMFVRHTMFHSIGDVFDESMKTPEVRANGRISKFPTCCISCTDCDFVFTPKGMLSRSPPSAEQRARGRLFDTLHVRSNGERQDSHDEWDRRVREPCATAAGRG